MRGFLTALALALPCALGAGSAAAQEADSAAPADDAPLTAEKIIEVARERLRPPGVRRPCRMSQNANEIIVCAPDADENRVESPTEEAIRTGQSMDEGLPRAPNVDGPGIFQGKGIPLGKDPEPPLIVDLTNVPEGLSAEDAARVYRVEDGPPREMPPLPDATP